MAQEVYLRIIVQDGDVETATAQIRKLGNEVEVVDSKSKKAGKSLEKGFSNAQESASNLEGGIQGAVVEVVNLGKAAKAGGAAMRAAFISTGIGALIVALGLVVSNWEKISEWVGLVNKDLERQNELLAINNGVLSKEEQFLLARRKRYEQEGRDLEEIDSKIAQFRYNRLEELRQQIEVSKKLYAQLLAAAQADPTEENVKAAADAKKATLDLAIERERLLQAISEANTVLITGSGKKDTPGVSRPKNLEGAGDVAEDPEVLRRLAVTDELKRIEEDTNAFLAQETETLIDRNIAAYEKFTTREAELAELRKQIARSELNAKLQTAQNVLGAIGGLLEENSAVAKGIAVAQTTISTYQGIVNALAAKSVIPDPLGQALKVANAVAIGIAGLANVKKIIATKPVENKAPSINATGGRGGGVQAPSFNVVGASGQNQIAQTLAERDEQPIQAYVVGSNVTSQQSLDRNIQDTATIG